jgi:hypothetical protein
MTANLHFEELLADARRRTGLDDFGDPWFHEPLQVLLESISDEIQLNETGRHIWRKP